MSVGFCYLPPEMKEHIYDYCNLNDLRNIACCSTRCYDSVQYLLWSCVEIPWRTFSFKTLPWKKAKKKSMHLRRLSNLKFTHFLRFREDWCGKLSGEKRWTCVADHYKRVLDNCDPSKLVKIYLDRVIADQGLVWTCHQLYMLEEIYLNCCYHVTDQGWKQLASLKQLRKLSIRNCEVRDSSIQRLLTINQLKELRLDQCLLVTRIGLRLISSLSQLEKLTFSYNWHIEANVYESFAKLRKLVDLDLRYTNVDDCVLECLIKAVPGLKSLTLRGCHNISDVGLTHLSSLSLLEELDVSECSKVTVLGLCELTALITLKKLVINHPRTMLPIID